MSVSERSRVWAWGYGMSWWMSQRQRGSQRRGELLTGPWVSLQDRVPLLISNQGWVVPGTGGEGALGLKCDPGTGNRGSPGLSSPVRERAVPRQPQAMVGDQ